MTVVREVSARLGITIGDYVRDVRHAGRETDKAFASMTASSRAYNRELGVQDIRTRNADAAARQLHGTVGRLDSRLSKLPTTLGRSSDGVRRLGADVGQLDGRLSDVAAHSADVDRGLRDIGTSARQSVHDVRVADRGINDLTGRLRAIGKVALVGGPGLIPIGALGIAGIVGLANQLGVLAAVGGSVIVAFQGVGDAVTAVNDYALEPTADNALKAQQALDRLSPAAQDFVNRLSELRSVGGDIRDAAAEGFFPGATRGLNELETLAPRVQDLVGELGAAAGDVLADGAESLASGRWTDFLDYLEDNGRSTLEDLASAAGSAAHGVSELIMAMDPTNDGFGDWLAERAGTFDAWASGLQNSDGAQKFMAYVAETGPQVSDTIGAIANALTGIVTSAAPLGGPVLQGIEVVADALGFIADSPVGDKVFTFAAAFVALNSALAITGRLAGSLGFAGIAGALASARPIARGTNAVAPLPTRPTAPVAPVAPVPAGRSAGVPAAATSSTAAYAAAQSKAAGTTAALTSESDKQGRSMGTLGRTVGLAAAGTAAFALATSDTGKELGVQNTAMLGLVGYMAGPWGAAIGASIGMIADAKAANEGLETSYDNLRTAIDVGAPIAEQEAAFSAAEQQLADYERRVEGVFGNGGFGDFSKLEGPGDFFSGAVGGIASLWGGGLDAAREDLRELRQEMDWAAEGEQVMGDLFGQSINVSTDGIRAATDDINALREAFGQMVAELSGRASMRDYEAALDSVNASIKENGKSLDITTEKGRANAAALESIASTSLSVAENLEGMERLRFLERARSDFVDAAMDFDLTRRQANRLADELGFLDNLIVEPKVKNPENLPRFRGDVDALRRSYESMPQSVRTALLATGIPKSKRDARELGRQYNLTPRQIRTLVRLTHQGALRGIRDVDQLLTQLDGEKAQTRVDADVDKAIRGVGRTGTLVGNLGRQVANPKADLNSRPAEGKAQGLQKMLQYLSGMRPTPMAGLNDRASGPIRGIQGLLNSIDGRHTESTHTHTNTTVNKTINVRGNAEGGLYVGGALQFATGGVTRPWDVRDAVASYAVGGVNAFSGFGDYRDPRDTPNGHSPELARSGQTRIWREEETGGEAYIPLRNDYRRPRAQAIVEETAAIFGGSVTWNARGGVYTPSSMDGARRAASGGGGRAAALEVSGWLDTPWGPAEVRGIARDEAEDAVAGAAQKAGRRSYAQSTTWYDEEG